MKVLKGVYKGIELAVPQDGSVRPTVDHFKKHVMRLAGNPQFVWDLFAGSGGVGIEFLSQGAKEVLFVEQTKRAFDCLTLNLAECHLKNHEIFKTQKIEKLLMSTESFLNNVSLTIINSPDLVFLDPPYGQGQIEKTLQQLFAIKDKKFLILAEHASDEIIPVHFVNKVQLQEAYGPKTLTMLVKEK